MAMFDVIKFDGNGKTLVYKYPHEDFNTKSQLVVQQAQEAIFYSRGAMADHFTIPGTYTLETKNIPILCHLVNLPFGKESPFHATVYFIDRTERMNNKWGVGMIPFVAKEYGLPMNIGLCGEYSFKIGDAQVFINKVLGTVAQYDDEQIIAFSNKFVQQLVTATMSKYLAENSFDLFTLEIYLVELSSMLQNQLTVAISEYGIELTKFLVTNVAKHEESPEYKRFYDLYTIKTQELEEGARSTLGQARVRADIEIAEVQKQGALHLQGYDLEMETKAINLEAYREKTMKEAEAAGLSALGMSKAQEEAFEVAKLTAQNEGAGNFAAAGMGIGMGIGTMGAAASAVGGLYNDALSQIGNSFTQQNSSQTSQQTSFGADIGAFSVDVGLGNSNEASQNAPFGSRTKYCDNCGSELTADAQFCDNCGAQQIVANKCKKCGFIFERPGKFCPQCGEKRES